MNLTNCSSQSGGELRRELRATQRRILEKRRRLTRNHDQLVELKGRTAELSKRQKEQRQGASRGQSVSRQLEGQLQDLYGQLPAQYRKQCQGAGVIVLRDVIADLELKLYKSSILAA